MYGPLGIIIPVLAILTGRGAETAMVDSVTPSSGSLNGETRLTIYGSGFSGNQFDLFGDPDVGNSVQLVSGTKSLDCPVHKDGTTEDQIMCYTPAGMPEDVYTVSVTVDGARISGDDHCERKASNCNFETKGSYTPTIIQVSPYANPPGEVVQINGKMFTDRYETSKAAGCNGRTERILRVFLGSKPCELRIDGTNDEIYGKGLDHNCRYTTHENDLCLANDCDSDWGYLKCKTTGTYVGNQNASFIISGKYGRSAPEVETYAVTAQNEIAMYQTYAIVDSVSPATGSVLGGTLLTITGDYFDETDFPAEVTVGGVSCAVQEVTDTTIVCEMGAEPSPRPGGFSGNRGILKEFFNNSDASDRTVYNMGTDAITNFTDSVSESLIDEMGWSLWEGDLDYYSTRHRGYFVPPNDNDYQFFVKGDDDVKLYLSTSTDPADKELVAFIVAATQSYTDQEEQVSERITLVGGQQYYFEVLQREGGGRASAYMAVHQFNTPYTASQAGNVHNEIQTIQMTSTVTTETLRYSLDDWTTGSSTNEVQVVEVMATTQAKFRLGMLGVYTERLDVGATASSVAAALNKLPYVADYSVSVSSSVSGVYTVTFNGDGGNWPALEVMSAETDSGDLVPVSSSVMEQTAGVSSLSHYRLAWGDLLSPPISKDADAAQVQAALMETFSIKCPSTLTDPINRLHYFDYESNPSSMDHFSGSRVDNVAPFCGRYSLKNPWYLFKNYGNGFTRDINTQTRGKLCFAYHGMMIQRVLVLHTLTTSNGEYYLWDHFNIDMSVVDEWGYVCVDLYEEMKAKRSDTTSSYIHQITIQSVDASEFWVDEVYIGGHMLVDEVDWAGLAESERRVPLWSADPITVTGDSDEFTVVMAMLGCGHDLPLMSASGATAQGGATADSATFRASSWPGSAAVNVTRDMTASPPVDGFFDLFYDGQNITVPADIDANTLAARLETLDGVGFVKVERSGTCAGYGYEVEFIAGAPGDHPEFEVDTSELTGTDANVTVSTDSEGGVFYDPILGDMMRTYHDMPEVSVVINGIPSKCNGSCGFDWSQADTPSVTAITPTSGSESSSTILTITGTDFSTDDDTVTIGDTDCDITSATATELQCTIGQGPAGAWEVIVNVGDKGLAEHVGGPFNFTYDFSITSINPTSGSLAGGTELTLTGTGFGDTVTVTVNGNDCPISSTSYENITCTTPSESAGTYDVIVSDGTNSDTAGTQFTYDASLTATVSSISGTDALVEGGTEITLTGTSFGSAAPSDDTITLGGATVTVDSWSDTSIDVVLPPLGPGSYPLVLNMDNGYADTSAVSDILYTLEVSDLSPDHGSLMGGTAITLTGSGFSANSTSVKLEGVACDVVEVSAGFDELVCVTGDPTETYIVTNMGVHPDLGEGYAWDRSPLTIQVGDSVQWEWSTPELLTEIGYRVEQTNNETDKEFTGSGFQSSTSKTANGMYTYRFTETGTYYYWSGCVDDNCDIKLRGTVKVVEDESFAADLEVKIGEFEALYYVPVMSGKKRRKRSTCASEENAIGGCAETAPSSGAYDYFDFAYWSCATPTVDSIEPTQATSMEVINIYGSGFGSSDCQNEVLIGGQTCVIQESSDTSLNCTLDPADVLQVGVPYEVEVVVNNRGSSLMTIADDLSRRFVLMPHVMTVSPSSGSTAGGTRITIDGDAFSASAESTSVTIAGTACDIESLTYDQIVCVTGNSYATVENVTVTVMSNGAAIPAICEGLCDFAYDSSVTPTVSAVDPTLIASASTTLTITGTDFGSVTGDVSVNVGSTSCTVTSVSDTEIQCDAGEPMVGDQDLEVRLDNVGYATLSVSTVTVDDVIDSVSPTTGSVMGGTLLTISGLGFDADDTEVTVGGNQCNVTSVTAVQIICQSPEADDTSSDTSVTVTVVSGGETYSSTPSFDYDIAQTPTITGISPSSASSGETVTVSGTGFSSSTADVTVTIGGEDCSVTSASTTSIDCTLGSQSAGTYDPMVHISGLGLASGGADYPFTYELAIDSVSPSTGSFGGGQLVTLTGKGFDESMTNVTICDQLCEIVGTPTPTELECETPASLGSGSTEVCDVVVQVGGASDTDSASYTYDESLTPSITTVDPVRGGTGGGTSITVTGTGFGTTVGDVTVTIADSDCSVDTLSDTEIVCTTGSHSGSIMTLVRVEIGSDGIATQDNADFRYIDVWSSQFTWGGADPPVAGDMVVIPAEMTLLLDIDTPVLSLLLIQGGQLIFDEVDVELQAEKILIVDGGLLQVGTEDEPFQHKAIITLHGYVTDSELPIYGTKMIAVREGNLELHGQPVTMTWTHLAATANAGATTITLQNDPGWAVGDEIVIATTGDRNSMRESEVRVIDSISGSTLTLTEALEYDHLGETTMFASHGLETRAEVGLLTHNVVVRGSNNAQWNDAIEPCDDGFNPGEFATQTCFQGRFGEDVGGDKFGGHIIFHAPRKSEGLVTGHIENVELTNVGQAFRLGRYAIHFHINGDMTGSYVRGCSIHQSNNRATNIHHTHNVMVEHNVAYNIMGGCFFLEDGIETGNTIQYNLAVFVISSTSLQNDDITPAAFWVTNPNNTIRHNAAAGGTHFGFWYRMHDHPDAGSFDANICPKKVPLLEFFNNTVHSHGWFGLWIFEEFYPVVNGDCDGTEPVTANFQGLTAWNCEKGAETVGGSAIQFTDFFFANNDVTGYDFKLIKHLPTEYNFRDDGPLLANGVITANGGGVLVDQHTQLGVTLPYGFGFKMTNVVFVDFDDRNHVALGVTKVDGTSEDENGAFTYGIEGAEFENSPSKIKWRWLFEACIHDIDGSMTGTVGGKVVPDDPTLPDSCSVPADGDFSPYLPASVCPGDVKFHRFAWNGATPNSLNFKDTTFRNQYGESSVPFNDKAITHKQGWVILLVDGETYFMEFENAEHISNISYTATAYDFEDDDFVIVKHNFTQRADNYKILQNDVRDETMSTLTHSNSLSGDWHYDNTDNILEYMLSSKTLDTPSGTRAVPTHNNVHLNVFRCFYADCIAPLPQEEVPPETERPDTAVYWSQRESWAFSEEGYGSYFDDGTYGLPTANTDVMIPKDVWMVVDTPLPILNKLEIFGTLEFEQNDTFQEDLTLSATHIRISGGRLIVGWENKPFISQAEIILRGTHDTTDLPVPNGPAVGSKAIGVFGGLDMHGIQRNITWTQLAATVEAGDRTITLLDEVDWSVGDEIVIATTSFEYAETETATIEAIDGDTLTLTEALQYNHISVEETIAPGRKVLMAAEVGLLSHNVRIVGADYAKLNSEAFGARVIVGYYNDFNADGELTEYWGYARLTNVEFYHAGQEGFVDFYDPRFSLAFLDTGDVTENRPQYVRYCSFNHNFAPAIGVFGANGVDIEHNVVYHTVGASFQVQGSRNRMHRNLLTRMMFPGTFNGRYEERLEVTAAIEIQEASDVILTYNHVAGSERAGIRTDGEVCPEGQDASALTFTGNVVHSSLLGLLMYLPSDGLDPCSALANFFLYRNYDWGTYAITTSSLKYYNIISIDNGVGLYPFVYQPPAKEHAYKSKSIEVYDSVFVGTSSTFDCDDGPPAGDNYWLFDNLRSWRTPTRGMNGMIMGTFSSGENGSPFHPMNGIMAYQAIRGITKMQGNTFSKFDTSCGGRENFAIGTPVNNDDGIHPMEVSDTTLYKVNKDNLILFTRPRAGTINPSDCIDMDCDGLKKAIIIDKDGTLLKGPAGSTIIAESEWEWDQDPQRGLGDFRIPVALLTDPTNGDRIATEDMCPNKGIYRDNTCTYKDSYQAWECVDPSYYMLMLESMDWDTETRRLSPISVYADGYVDLVNGPQDHGWCMGYTCQERLSTFPIILAAGQEYKIYMTGTTPQNLRYHWLNNEDATVLVGVWYAAAYRLDVSADGVYVMPTNAEYNDQGQMLTNSPPSNDPDLYMPDMSSDEAGANYFDGANGILWLLLKGGAVIDVETADRVILSFGVPAMTVDEFFGENIVSNLALFLGIPADKIRYAIAVPESRRKRDTTTTITVTIENPPGGNLTTDPSALSSTQFTNISSEIISTYQLGGLDIALDITIVTLSVTEPPPDTDSDLWQVVAELGVAEAVTLQVPSELELTVAQVVAQEGSAFPTQPALRFLDQNGDYVSLVGSSLDPWQIQASLTSVGGDSDSDAVVLSDTVSFSEGWANFTALRVTHSGTYNLHYDIIYPTGASHFTLDAGSITVTDRQLSGQVAQEPNDTYAGVPFEIEIEITDAVTGEKVDDVDWKGHTFTCDVSLHRPEIYKGSLSGSMSAVVDSVTGIAIFDDLEFEEAGRHYLSFNCMSSPTFYDFTFVSSVLDVYPADYEAPTIEVSKRVVIKFENDFSSVALGEEEYIGAAVYNELWGKYPQVNHRDHSVYEGSIMVEFYLDGTTVDVENVTNSMWEDLKGELTITYNGVALVAAEEMWVEGSDFYGLDGPSEADSSSLPTWAIILIAVGGALLLALVLGLLYYKHMYRGKEAKKLSSISPTASRADLASRSTCRTDKIWFDDSSSTCSSSTPLPVKPQSPGTGSGRMITVSPTGEPLEWDRPHSQSSMKVNTMPETA